MTRVMGAFLFVATIMASGCEEGSEDVTPSRVRTERPRFDSGRAYRALIQQVDFGPRFPGSEGHANQLAWMLSELEGLADTVYTDEFEYTTADGTDLSLTNVMARFGTTEGDGQPILLTAHWDTRPWASEATEVADRDKPILGANDGASGVAILLELARMFAEQAPPSEVIVLLSDGEDYGPATSDMFLGAKQYASNRASDDAPVFGILLDMVGDADPMFPMESYSTELAPHIVQRVYGIARDLGYQRYFPVDRTARVIDDHIELNQAGIPTIDIIDFDYGPNHSYWHTLDDLPVHTSPQTLGIVGEVVAEVVYRQR